MVYTVSVITTPENENNKNIINNEIKKNLASKNIIVDMGKAIVVIEKKSIDARRKVVKIVLKCKVYIDEEPPKAEDTMPKWIPASGANSAASVNIVASVNTVAGDNKTVVIVGSGPAGLFGALTLFEYGIKSIIIERGEDTHKRKIDIASISRNSIVDPDSNYCFGEGGAGTFSDGKLYTRSDKRGDVPLVLRIFNYFGADENILTDAHPHIGTDKLPSIINAMREKIVNLGGDFLFNTKCTDLITEKSPNGERTVIGVRTINTKTGEKKEIKSDAVMLATGHSANDIYEMIAKLSPQTLEAKGFAMGVRVEHPKDLINSIQYHRNENVIKRLGTAEYRLTSQQDGRGVYSFCMCPGGFVVPSATAPNQIVVNGMSTAKRNSPWSNAAIVVEIRPEDVPENFRQEAEKKGIPALAGLLWRTWLEEETFRNGDGQKAPAQIMTDFLSHRDSTNLPDSSYAPGLCASRLDLWLPEQIEKRLESGFRTFDKAMKGYITKQALLIASETRTSTPVRIRRDKETGECNALHRLYASGEGSGYSGGIVSSAMDGIKICHLIAKSLKNLNSKF